MRREVYIFWVLLIILLGKQTEDSHLVCSDLLSGLVFVNNAITIGTLRYAVQRSRFTYV